MENRRFISSVGAAIAVLSILFLPVIGCQDMNMTGLELIRREELGQDIKYLIIAAVVCGILTITLKNLFARGLTAIGGGLALLFTYVIARGQNEFFELKVGSFIAIIGYAVSALICLSHSSETASVEPTTVVDKESS